MIRINLLPVKEAQRAMGRRRQISVGALSVAVALLMMIIPFMLQGRRMSRLDSEMDDLQAQVAKLESQAKEVKDLDKKRTDLKAKLKIIDDLKRKRVGPVRILEDLGSASPEKLWLVEFSDIGGNATITGMALDNQTIAEFMRSLQSSKYFYDVDLVETAQTESVHAAVPANPQPGGGSSFKKFIVKARLDYLGMDGKQAAPAPAGPGAAAGKSAS
ncbi:MAG TPA: PilN domain-containing protein [Candidatus Acidoferrales bacterium]|nr:PilN domain-containing protein [Candidatus Acidoferrales bacterium]